MPTDTVTKHMRVFTCDYCDKEHFFDVVVRVDGNVEYTDYKYDKITPFKLEGLDKKFCDQQCAMRYIAREEIIKIMKDIGDAIE